MVHSTKMRAYDDGLGPSSDPHVDGLIPVVEEIRRAVGELRVHFDGALDEIRSRIEGRHKALYTVEEVAAMTGRAPYTVRAWIKRGLIAATRVHGTGPKGRLLVPHEELRRLVESGRGCRVSPVAIDGPSPPAPLPRSTVGRVRPTSPR
jgi:hypothetical protein